MENKVSNKFIDELFNLLNDDSLTEEKKEQAMFEDKNFEELLESFKQYKKLSKLEKTWISLLLGENVDDVIDEIEDTYNKYKKSKKEEVKQDSSKDNIKKIVNTYIDNRVGNVMPVTKDVRQNLEVCLTDFAEWLLKE